MTVRRLLSFCLGPALLAVLVAALGSPTASAAERTPVATDSTDALSWARAVVQTRRAVQAAEAALDPDEQADLARHAFLASRALANGPLDDSLRDLLLRAQAVYETHHGAVDAVALSPAEIADLRGPALAALREPDYSPDLVDPAVVAAERAAAVEAARRAAAEAARAAGPSYLFYPAEAEAFVERQRGVARRRFSGLRHRTRRLFPQMERTLRRRSVPTDFKYVAVIESALNPEAESHAGARGLWQFMPETAAEYGLDSLAVADPAASTDAAARYLGWLGRRFRGDWQLALAAYNCGVGRVEALVRAHRAATGETPTFWDLHDALPRETQEYVPRFIAVAEMLGGRRG